MSVEAMAIVLNHSAARGSARLVLLGIANHHGDGGAWPTLGTLARYAGGITDRNVRNALRELERLGEIVTGIEAGPRRRDGGRPNRYQLLIDCPATCDRSMNHRDLRVTDTPLPPVVSDLRPPVVSDLRPPVVSDLRPPVASDPQTRRGTIR